MALRSEIFSRTTKKHLASLVMKRRSDKSARAEAGTRGRGAHQANREHGLRRARKRKQEMQLFPPVTSLNKPESSTNQGPRQIREGYSSRRATLAADAAEEIVADGQATPRGRPIAAVRAQFVGQRLPHHRSMLRARKATKETTSKIICMTWPPGSRPSC